MQDFCGRTAWPQGDVCRLIRITWSLFVNIVATVIELRLVVTHDLFGVRSVKCYYFKDQFPILGST